MSDKSLADLERAVEEAWNSGTSPVVELMYAYFAARRAVRSSGAEVAVLSAESVKELRRYKCSLDRVGDATRWDNHDSDFPIMSDSALHALLALLARDLAPLTKETP